jgi:hypothetical protein
MLSTTDCNRYRPETPVNHGLQAHKRNDRYDFSVKTEINYHELRLEV